MTANIGRLAYVGAIPWHGLGKKIAGAMTWEEAIVAAELDWQVLQAPLHYVTTEGIKSYPERVVNYRGDNGNALGIVGHRYPVVQNKTTGSVLDAVIGEKGAHYEVAGYLGGGEKVWCLVKLPGVLCVVGDDVVEKYLLCCNGHDGSMAFMVIETTIRVVCQNTLTAAINGGKGRTYRQLHKGQMNLNAQDIRACLGYAESKFNVLEQAYQKMAGTKLTDPQAHAYFKQVIDYPLHQMVDGKLQDEASSRMKNRLDDLIHLYNEGQGTDLKGVRGTAWGAFNAVTEYADYFNGKSNEGRAMSTLFGAGAKMKEIAFALATV